VIAESIPARWHRSRYKRATTAGDTR